MLLITALCLTCVMNVAFAAADDIMPISAAPDDAVTDDAAEPAAPDEADPDAPDADDPDTPDADDPDADDPGEGDDPIEPPAGINVTIMGEGTLYRVMDDGEMEEVPEGFLDLEDADDLTLTMCAVGEYPDGCFAFADHIALEVTEIAPEDPEATGATWEFTMEAAEYTDLLVIFTEEREEQVPVWISCGEIEGTIELLNEDEEWEPADNLVTYAWPERELAIRAVPSEPDTIAYEFWNNGVGEAADLYGAGFAEYHILVAETGNAVLVDFQRNGIVQASYDELDGALYVYQDEKRVLVESDGQFPLWDDEGTTCWVEANEPDEMELGAVFYNDEPVEFSEALAEDLTAGWEFTLDGDGGELELLFDEIAGPEPGEDGNISIAEGAPDDLAIIMNIDEDGLALVGLMVTSPTTVGQLKTWIAVPEGYGLDVLTKDGASAEDPALVTTDMMLTATGLDEEEAADRVGVVVTGDVLGTGEMNIAQLVRMAKAINKTQPLEGLALMAADITDSGALDIADLVAEARFLTEN